MIFITKDEIVNYTTTPIDDVILTQSNAMLTSLVGEIGKKSTTNERMEFGKYRHPKLKNVRSHIPLISVDKVQTVTRTPFGIEKETVDTSDVYVDEMGYVDYLQPSSLALMIFGTPPSELLIDYTWGWETVPEDLKFAAAALAQNLSKRGTSGLTSLTDFDVKLAFVNDSIVTSDIRVIIARYKGV